MNIDVASSNAQYFTNSFQGDVVFYSDSPNQKILFGHDTTKQAIMTLDKDTIIVDKSIVPANNVTCDLGASTKRFRDLYLSGNTIDIGGTKISIDSNSDVKFAGSNDVLKRIVVDQLQLGDGQSKLTIKQASGQLSVTNVNEQEMLSVLPATTAVAGIVRLNDSLTDNSTTTAATANSVRQAYNLASNALMLTGGTISGTLHVTGTLSLSSISGTIAASNTVLRQASLSNCSFTGTNTLSNASLVGGTINATTLMQGNTTVALNGHTHSASDITSGTMATSRLPTASTTSAGIVQLNNNINSSDTSSAATPNAVMLAYNRATTALDTASTASTNASTAYTLAAAALPKAGTTLDTTAINLTYFETTRRGSAPDAIIIKRTCGNNAVSNGMGASILFMTQRAASSGTFESGRIAGYIAGGAESSSDTHGIYISAFGNNSVEEKVLYIFGGGGGRLGINKVPNQALDVNGNFAASGTKTFVIEHPSPAMASKGYKLRHSCIESPSADNYYRYLVVVKNGIAVLPLPSYFKFLNTNVQIVVSPTDSFGVGYGRLNATETEVDVHASIDGVYNVFVTGTRKDADALKADSRVEFIEYQ